MSKYLTLLYYKYSTIEDPAEFARMHLVYCKELGLRGRIIVAGEGINGTVSGPREACNTYMKDLREDPNFKDIEFKVDATEELSFTKMFVRHRDEIVTSGLDSVDMTGGSATGRRLSPEQFQEEKNRGNVILLDVRNKLEYELGRFKNATSLDIDHFRDFKVKVDMLSGLKDQNIIAYCTGGIRCEKATAFLISQGFKHVSQLDGGILNYGKSTGGKDFDGKCYVFDERLSVDVNTVNPMVISKCRNCGSNTVRMINCANPSCNEHFCQCEACGGKYDGSCSSACQDHPDSRTYDGTGYYVKMGS